MLVGIGVGVSYSLHLTLGELVAGALAREQETRARGIARLVAAEASHEDAVTLQNLVTASVWGNSAEYCLVVRRGRVVASSLPEQTSQEIADLRTANDLDPRVIVRGQARYLDVAEPIGDGSAGLVRVGVEMSVADAATHEIALLVESLALPVVFAGLLFAFALGRFTGHPIRALMAAVDRLGPAEEARFLQHRDGMDDVAELTERFHRMLVRFNAARQEQVRARQMEGSTERMAALGSLVAGVAHEINNPLAGMKNCLRRLQRDEAAAPDPKRQEYLGLMEEGLERIERAIRRLLDYARPRPMRLVEVPLADVVNEATGLIQPLLVRRQIALRVDDAAGMGVVADRRQIGQALLNLLLNAAYVTTDGGEIGIRIREEPGLFGIAIQDDGPGIPAEIRGRIMDPYFSTKPEGEGTGLGLSVSRSIVEAHGGDLTLEFPKRGTIATIWLRATPADVEADAPAEADG